jgi:hypothetical protein
MEPEKLVARETRSTNVANNTGAVFSMIRAVLIATQLALNTLL